MADNVKLLAVIDANTKAFENALKRIERQTAASFGRADKSVKLIESSLGRASASVTRLGRSFGLAFTGAAAIAVASSAIRKFIQETAESEASVAQLNAVLKSTGNVAGVTAKELQDLASSLANVSVFEDDAIVGVESLLLAFRKISGEPLPRATAAVLDLSTRLKMDLGSASKLVGKALQDPVKAFGALQKAGIILSASQKTIITNLVKTGQVAKFQNIILKEMERSFGGAALAARETLGGALTALSVAWGELFEISGPASSRLRVAIENLIKAISDPAFKDAVQTIGVGLVDALKAIADIAPSFISNVKGIAQGIIDLGHDARTTVDNIEDVRDTIREWLHLPPVELGIDKQIDRAHDSAARLKPQLELLAALQKKLSIAPGEAATQPAAGGVGNVDADAAAEEELASQIEREAKAQKELAKAREKAADATFRQRVAVTEMISDLKFENRIMGLSNKDRAVEIALRRAGAEATATQRLEIAQLVNEGIGEQKLIDRMDELRSASLGALDAFAQSIQNGEGAAEGLKAALVDVLQTIIRIGEQQAITSLFGGAGQTGGGLLGGIIGGLFGAATGGSPALGSLSAAGSVTGGNGRAGPNVVQLHVVEGELFRPVVRAISGDVVVRHTSGIESRANAPRSRRRARQSTAFRHAMTTFGWPESLKPRDFGFSPIEADTSGGAATGGGEQFIASPGPRWSAAMTLDVRNNDQVLLLRSLRTKLKGRANPIALPNFDGQRLSWPIEIFNGNSTGVVLKPSVVRRRNLEGSQFEDPAIPTESEIVATVNALAALRATTIGINVTQGGAIRTGQQFGIGQRLYEIGTIESVVGTVTMVTFMPPLRESADAGTEVKFTRPVCLMRCMNLNEEMRSLELLRFATLNLEFVEYL